MATDQIGDVEVIANPDATADPVTQQPPDQNTTNAAFAETINKSHLSEIIFDAFPAVQDFINNTPDARVKWPDGYGTTTPPWGREFDPVTGFREEQSTGERWTAAINGAAEGRQGSLQEYGDQAVAIATGILAALNGNTRRGTGVLVAGVSAAIPLAGS